MWLEIVVDMGSESWQNDGCVKKKNIQQVFLWKWQHVDSQIDSTDVVLYLFILLTC